MAYQMAETAVTLNDL